MRRSVSWDVQWKAKEKLRKGPLQATTNDFLNWEMTILSCQSATFWGKYCKQTRCSIQHQFVIFRCKWENRIKMEPALFQLHTARSVTSVFQMTELKSLGLQTALSLHIKHSLTEFFWFFKYHIKLFLNTLIHRNYSNQITYASFAFNSLNISPRNFKYFSQLGSSLALNGRIVSWHNTKAAHCQYFPA